MMTETIDTFVRLCVCASCARPVTRKFPDVAVVVERGDETFSVYCAACAGTLVYVSEAVEQGRILRSFVAAGGKMNRKLGGVR